MPAVDLQWAVKIPMRDGVKLAKQPYCNGKVTMWGGSYAGFDQWTVLKEFPPHLATIVPAAAAHPGVDFPFQYNINKLHTEWHDCAMKGGAKPEFLATEITGFVKLTAWLKIDVQTPILRRICSRFCLMEVLCHSPAQRCARDIVSRFAKAKPVSAGAKEKYVFDNFTFFPGALRKEAGCG